jgi:hypothetical protein
LARADCRTCVVHEKCFREARACELDPGCGEAVACPEAADAEACPEAAGAASAIAVEECARFYCETACYPTVDCSSDEGLAQCRLQVSTNELACASSAEEIHPSFYPTEQTI